MLTALLKNVRIYKNGRFETGDLSVRGGIVCADANNSAAVIDFSGKYIFPGFADVHVHLREPGFSYKETIASGTAAAAHGGYTDICSMPNLSPAPDCAKALSLQLEIIRRDAVIRVHPYGTITRGEQGKELVDMASMPAAIAFSDDGRGVQSEQMMEAAMRQAAKAKKIIAAHCEDEGLLHGGYIHDGAYAAAHGHRGICSESEWRAIERDIELVRKTGAAYHVCHVSAKESVALIREAKREGLNITCETAPHYLTLCEDDMREDGRFKMNPPLRTADDRDALIEGILDGTVDIIATDHAPHSANEKNRGLEHSAMGIVGLETAFPVLYTRLVKTGILTLESLVQLMSTNPRKRFSLGGGSLEAGDPADFCIYDLSAEYAVNPTEFLSLGRATPFEGERVFGRCLLTVCGGDIAYSSLKGVI